jgi:GntR family transcriptional regulator/MocR family aminotransferase
MRPRYRARRDALVAALARELPQWRVSGVAAGLNLVALLPPATDERALLARAAAAGMVLHGLSQYRVAPGPPGLVLGFGNVSEPAIARGVRRLAQVYAELEEARAPEPEPEPAAR